MIAAVRTWLTAVAAVSLLLSVVQYITPKGTLRDTASFIGVAPMDDPQIAVLVAINDLPESATHGGGAIAAPMFTWALLNTKSR